jgi:hypothetical protein
MAVRNSPGATTNFTTPLRLHQDAKKDVLVRRFENKPVIFPEGVYLECGSSAAAFLRFSVIFSPHGSVTAE